MGGGCELGALFPIFGCRFPSPFSHGEVSLQIEAFSPPSGEPASAYALQGFAGMMILQVDTSRGFGGQQEWVLRLSDALAKSGHRVILACSPDTPLARRGAERGLPMLALPVRNSLDLRAIQTLARTIRREKIDVIHTHNAITSWLAWFAGHAWPLVPRRPALIRTRHLMKKTRYGFPYRYLSDRVVAVSAHLQSYLVEEMGVPSSKVTVISPGIDTELYKPAPGKERVRAELGIPAGVPVIGMIAFLRRDKGQWVLIEAAPTILSRFPEARFLLVGSGGDEQKLRNSVRERGMEERFIFTGYRTDIPRLLTAIDFVAAPSLREGLGVSILEAMAAEKPVVASGVGGILEVVSDGENGLLAPPGNATALAETLLSLLTDPGRAKKMGEAGRKMVEQRYSLDRAVDQTVALYQSTRAERGHGRGASRGSDLNVPSRKRISG